MKKLKKFLLILCCFVLAVGTMIGVVIGMNMPTNMKAMNQSVHAFLETVDRYYPLKAVDCDDYSDLTLFGILKFNVKQYEATGVGNLAVMTTNVGLMQMATVVLTPVNRDLPLISMDYMYILGNRTAYVEIYDLVLDKNEHYEELMQQLGDIRRQYDNLETITPSAAWYDSLKTEGLYKKGTKADDGILAEMLEKSLDAIMQYGQTLPILEEEAHKEKAALQKTYSNGLIEHGGVSTDIFVKALGPETTRDFFDKVLFRAE